MGQVGARLGNVTGTDDLGTYIMHIFFGLHGRPRAGVTLHYRHFLNILSLSSYFFTFALRRFRVATIHEQKITSVWQGTCCVPFYSFACAKKRCKDGKWVNSTTTKKMPMCQPLTVNSFLAYKTRRGQLSSSVKIVATSESDPRALFTR